jgi:hypothetical protein
MFALDGPNKPAGDPQTPGNAVHTVTAFQALQNLFSFANRHNTSVSLLCRKARTAPGREARFEEMIFDREQADAQSIGDFHLCFSSAAHLKYCFFFCPRESSSAFRVIHAVPFNRVSDI